MIRPEEVYCIGKFTRTHGVQGEMAMTFTDDVFDRTDCPYLICSMDGILVPFFIEEYRFRSDTTALVKLDRIDTAEQARKFTNVEVYFPLEYVEEDDSDDIPTWGYFVGFQVTDINHGELGEIVAVDDSTMNVLFSIETPEGEEILLPAHEEFMVKLEKKKRRLTVEVPEGLL